MSTDGIGNDNVHANGNAHEQVYQQIDDERIRPDGRQGLVACELPYHGDVGSVEQLLQNTRRRERNSEPQNFSSERAVQHIHICFYRIRRHTTPKNGRKFRFS